MSSALGEASSPPVLAGANRIDVSGLSAVLDRIANPELLARGCVNVVGIEPVQEKLGPRWDRMKEHIYERVEKYIARHLTASEYHCRVSDAQYIISMPEENAHSAQLRCFRILEEILTTLLGRFTLEQIKIKAITGTEGEFLIARLVDTAALAKSAAMASAAKPGIVQENNVVAFAPPTRATITVGEKELHLQFEFHPVWDLHREAITSFALYTAVETEQSRASGANKIPRAQLLPEELSAIDIAASEHGRDILNYLLGRQTQFILHLPCGYETLANSRSRQRFLETVKRLSPELRRYVAYELVDLPIGIPQSRISSLVAMLKPFGRGVLASVRPTRAELLTFHGCGLGGLTLDLEALDLREDEMFERIGLFRDLGHMTCDRLIAQGVNTRSLAIACWALGLTHMSGSSVEPPVAIPRRMHRFNARDLYRD
ncbi:MAG TPA: hypothetical protein VIJ62_09500 [Rhizomicrobium sp.]